MSELIVLDGSSYVFRAYYGLPPLHDDDGHNVNAIYGFFRMMFRLWEKRPDYFVIAWDSPKKTIRKEQYEEYKANRVKMPDEFKRQMGMIKQITDELGVASVEAPGYEADDIIASIAGFFADLSDVSKINIVSSDKDLKQLLTSGVVMFDPMKDNVYDDASFREEFGFNPEQMCDYLSLIGDSSDNIPGVRGIGPKTAKTLIQQRGDLESIYAHIDEFSGSTREKLEAGREMAYQSQSLVRLLDVPDMSHQDVSLWGCQSDFDKLKAVLVDEYKFRSLEKVLNELKKEWQSGEQLSLFG